MAKMKSSELVAKVIDVAKNYKTLYVMGCFGSPMTDANKARYCKNHSYNKRAARTAMIRAASSDTFGFDCVNLIKGILWGWTGDKSKSYGGAKYLANGVPDVSANGMIQRCTNVKTTGWDDMVPGEVVWMKGHIGVYIGNGLAVESTPSWDNQVQITAVKNIGNKAGYHARAWTKHGFLPYVDYDTEQKTTATPAVKVAAARSKDSSIKGTVRLKVTASILNVRSSASSKDHSNILKTVPRGAILKWYGYYTGDFYLVILPDKSTGYVHKNYLQK